MTENELIDNMGDPYWRIRNLYWIIDKAGNKVLFTPNDAQETLYEDLWHRNIVPKARQRGISTAVQIAMLDACLFTESQSAAVIAQDLDTSGSIFRKIRYAYDNLPPLLRDSIPLQKDTAGELIFDNDSSLTVATTVRGRTLQWLHVSEFAKICAKFPDRAREIVTGSLPSVDKDGVIVIESTSEGREGPFFDMTMEALNLHRANATLSQLDYRLHFFSWWDAPEYELPGAIIGEKDHEYFDKMGALIGREIRFEQRAWYVTKRRSEFAGDPYLMKQEYPTVVEECFEVSTEGAYFALQMAQVRKDGRIRSLPLVGGVPCDTYWDIGSSDGTAIWVKQKIGPENRFIRFYEDWNAPYSEAAKWLLGLGVVFGTHYLPHDADHVRQGQTENKSPRQMLEELLPGHRFEVVERIPHLMWGIQRTRDEFSTYWFDEKHCAAGIAHLDGYSKRWNERQGCWSEQPNKENGHSEAADALRQHAQSESKGSGWAGQPAVTGAPSINRYSRAHRAAAKSSKWIV